MRIYFIQPIQNFCDGVDLLDFYFELHKYLMDADRIPVAVCAIFLTVVFGMITGPVGGNANPFFWFVLDRIFGRLGDRMDKPDPRAIWYLGAFFFA
jgi:hypothetical protein